MGDIYKDIDLNFGVNIYGDVAKVVDVNAIRQAVKNAIMINKGEKLFNPGFGTEINNMLFEPIDDDFISDLIIDEATLVLQKEEPRVDEIEITVDNGLDNNEIEVDISFSIKNSDEFYDVKIILERRR